LKPARWRGVPRKDDHLHDAAYFIEGWLSNHSWSLKWTRDDDDHANFTDRCIVINSRRTPASQVYGMLHEIGHIILASSPDYETRFSESSAMKRRRERRREPLKVKMQSLGEEWEAWALGEQFARDAGLGIDFNGYYKARDRDLKSYVSWVME
jgi:hypothetical protein